jgi:hypothetical protein
LSLSLSFAEKELRMTDAHIAAVKNVCRQRDLFLFLRPSEVDSVLLIKAGYATKSMDVHHKSSNWGPMAGFVPCDPAFSKKFEGVPEPAPAPHGHLDAQPVHLFITDELLQYFLDEEKLLPADNETLKSSVMAAGHLRAASDLAKGVVDKARADGNVGSQFSFFTATAPPRKEDQPVAPPFVTKTIFALKRDGDNWIVSFLHPVPLGHKIVPLWVFGYKDKTGKLLPVTGDYDIWMAAPHARWWKLHSHSVAVRDSHGSSAATMFNTWLIDELNHHCCGSKPDVFNHGAEAQNYGFTQALDSTLVMIGPMGTARVVNRTDLPKILAEIQLYGYMVIVNKRWLEDDPRLMNKQMEEKIRMPREQYLDAIRRLKNAKEAGERQQIKAEKVALAKQIPEHAPIIDFSRKLDKVLQTLWTSSTELNGLLPGERPPQEKRLDPQVGKALQTELSNILVQTTKGNGESDEARLEEWFLTKLPLLEQLSDTFGPAPAGPDINSPLGSGSKDGDFILRKLNKTDFARGTSATKGGPLPNVGGHHH